MKLNNPLIRKIGATTLGVLLLIYIGYQVFLVNYKGLTTETAMYAEMSDSVQASGWAVRNEEVITSPGNGVLSYNVADGGKVAKGNIIADIYAGEESAAAHLRLEQLNTEIANLETLKSVGSTYSSSADLVGTQINTSLVGVLENARKGEYRAASKERDRMQYLMNQKRIITGKEGVESYEGRIGELKAERDSLIAAASQRTGSVEAPSSGYFISGIDGYETAFDVEDIKNITVSEINSTAKGGAPASAAGKVAKDFVWYMVCVLTEEQKIKLERVEQVKLEIPLTTAEEIPAKVVAVNKDEETGTYALVLQCDYMNAELAAIRNETIQIVVNDYTGVKVSQKAIHFETITKEVEDENGNTVTETYENVKGVYIKYGQRINFVQVFSDVTINGLAVCKLDLSDEEKALLVTDDTIQLYDEVVTEGTDLYDGKLL